MYNIFWKLRHIYWIFYSFFVAFRNFKIYEMDNYYRLNSRLITNLGDVLSKPVSEMINAVGMPSSTWYHIMKHPENISIQQLLQIANTFHIPVRRFFY